MSSTLLLPPREQLCNRSCSNKTQTCHDFIGAGHTGQNQGQISNPDNPDHNSIRNYRDTSPQPARCFLAGVHMSTSGRIHGVLLRLIFFLSNGRRIFCGPWLSAAQTRVLSPSPAVCPATAVRRRAPDGARERGAHLSRAPSKEACLEPTPRAWTARLTAGSKSDDWRRSICQIKDLTQDLEWMVATCKLDDQAHDKCRVWAKLDPTASKGIKIEEWDREAR
jgi:hypothetical protein